MADEVGPRDRRGPASAPEVDGRPFRRHARVVGRLRRGDRGRRGGIVRGPGSGSAGQIAPYGLEQDLLARGLGQEVEGSELTGLLNLGLVVLGRGDQHAYASRGRVGAQLLQHLEAMDLGQHEVEDHQVGYVSSAQGQALFSVLGQQDIVSGAAKHGREDGRGGLGILGDEDHGTRIRGRHGFSHSTTGISAAVL